MTLKAKKISLGVLVAASIIAIPVITVVSCGSTEDKKDINTIESKDNWISKALKTESTKEMVFNNIDVKDKTVDMIKEIVTSIVLARRGNNLDTLKLKMDNASKVSFARFVANAMELGPTGKQVEKASDADLKRYFEEQKDTQAKDTSELLTLKTIVLNFSDNTSLKLTFTKEEQKKIKELENKSLVAIETLYNLEHYKSWRELLRAQTSKDKAKIDKLKKEDKTFQNKVYQFSKEGQKMHDDLKAILESHAISAFNKK